MQLHDLMAKLFELRQVAADQAKDGPSGSGAMARALTAYEWLGDNIEAFVDSLDPELTDPAPAGEAVDWLWWGCEEDGTEHTSLGRWQRHPCQHRYKLAAIQPTEHDHPLAEREREYLESRRQAWQEEATRQNNRAEEAERLLAQIMATGPEIRKLEKQRLLLVGGLEAETTARKKAEAEVADLRKERHPAPEDTARLRENLERDSEIKAWLVGNPATGQWVEVDGRRVEYSRGLGTPVIVLAEAFKAERDRADAAERERIVAHSERDNAVKALETADDILIRFIAAVDDVWSNAVEDVDLPLLRKLADVGRTQFAARSASREGASDE